MTFLLMAIFVLALAGKTFAQDQPCTCYVEQSVSDASCTQANNICGAPFTDCASVAFTPTCTGSYGLKASMDCDCATCLACATLVDGSGATVCEIHTPYTNNCTWSTTCTLTGGATYTLYACKRTCDPDKACIDACPHDCAATAFINFICP